MAVIKPIDNGLATSRFFRPDVSFREFSIALNAPTQEMAEATAEQIILSLHLQFVMRLDSLYELA